VKSESESEGDVEFGKNLDFLEGKGRKRIVEL